MTHGNSYPVQAETTECGACGGQGWYSGTAQVCCNHPNFDGSCCGYGVPQQTQVQCELCEGSGQVPSSGATEDMGS